MAIEIVSFPINSMVIFNSYVSSPEGIPRFGRIPKKHPACVAALQGAQRRNGTIRNTCAAR